MPLGVAAALLPIILAGCGESGTVPDRGIPGSGGGGGGFQPIEVRATDQFRFDSDFVEIPVEGTVRWVSDSGMAHTVTPTDHAGFERGTADQRGALIAEHVFLEPGTYRYHCEFHAEDGMRGVVVVSPP